MKEKLERFYSTFGDRGVMFILFAFSVVIHALLSLNMELPAVNPDEIGVASIAAFYAGKDWSGLMYAIGYYYGYVQAIFYLPLFLVFSSPYALYKAMLVMNGVLISFIPMIAYHLAAKIGVPKVWQKSVIALCCGFYVTYIAHSKFIWNEAISSLLPWTLIWCVYMAWDRKNRYSKFTFSMLTGFICALSFGAHSRLIAVVIALSLTMLIARFMFKEKILNLPAFFITMIISFVTEHFFRVMVQTFVWRGEPAGNTVEGGIERIGGLFEQGGFGRFVATLFGHLYTFCTSTLGIGTIAVTVFVLMCFSRLSEYYTNKKSVRIENGTKVYEPTKHRFSLRLVVFGIYGFLAIGGSMLLSVLYKFNSSQFGDVKDLVMFGRYTDNVAPLAIFLVLAFIYMYGFSIKLTASSAAIYAYVCFGFFTVSYPRVMDAAGYRESPVLGLMPWRIGEDIAESFTPLSFVIMTSAVFTLFAALIVCLSCTRRFKPQFISVVFCGIFTYTTLFSAFDYLPMRAEENLENTAPIKEICEFLYNDPESPQIIAYQTNTRTAALVQFLNPRTEVSLIRKAKNLPENGLVILENGTEIPYSPDEYDVVGTTTDFTVLACGQYARDYIKYKNTAD